MLMIPRVEKVQAIVLRALSWRDKDRLLVLLTKERGKIFALAQGAMRPQNRLAPVAQTGVMAYLWLAHAKELDRVTDVRIEQIPLRIRWDAFALAAFGVMAELLGKAAPAEVPDEELFDEVAWFCEQLEGGADIPKWLAAMQIRMLMRLGWAPHLLTCSACNTLVQGGAISFAPSVGGSLCGRCAILKAPVDLQVYPSAVLQALHSLLRQPKLLSTIHLRPALCRQALALEQTYWRYHLEAESQSWRVWKQLQRARLATAKVS